MSTELELFVRIKYAVPVHLANKPWVNSLELFAFVRSLPIDFLTEYCYACEEEEDGQTYIRVLPTMWSENWIKNMINSLVEYEHRRTTIS